MARVDRTELRKVDRNDFDAVVRQRDEARAKAEEAAELLRWVETYGHPEEWCKRAQAAHQRAERAEAERDEARTMVERDSKQNDLPGGGASGAGGAGAELTPDPATTSSREQQR